VASHAIPKMDPLSWLATRPAVVVRGGNIEYVPEEMVRNGAEAIHLATGLVVGYPPCPRQSYFKRYIEERYGIPVVIGTHPIPQKYLLVHKKLPSWDGMKELKALLATEEIRKAYD